MGPGLPPYTPRPGPFMGPRFWLWCCCVPRQRIAHRQLRSLLLWDKPETRGSWGRGYPPSPTPAMRQRRGGGGSRPVCGDPNGHTQRPCPRLPPLPRGQAKALCFGRCLLPETPGFFPSSEGPWEPNSDSNQPPPLLAMCLLPCGRRGGGRGVGVGELRLKKTRPYQ